MYCGCGLGFVYGLFMKFHCDVRQGWHVHVYTWGPSLFWMYMYSPSLSPFLSLSLSLSDFKSSHFPVVTTLSKQLLSHAFKLLPNCRSQFSLPLFRVILCLCAPGEGEESVLCESDMSLLKNIVRNNQTSLEKLLQERKQGLYILVYGLGHLSIFSVYFL